VRRCNHLHRTPRPISHAIDDVLILTFLWQCLEGISLVLFSETPLLFEELFSPKPFSHDAELVWGERLRDKIIGSFFIASTATRPWRNRNDDHKEVWIDISDMIQRFHSAHAGIIRSRRSRQYSRLGLNSSNPFSRFSSEDRATSLERFVDIHPHDLLIIDDKNIYLTWHISLIIRLGYRAKWIAILAHAFVLCV